MIFVLLVVFSWIFLKNFIFLIILFYRRPDLLFVCLANVVRHSPAKHDPSQKETHIIASSLFFFAHIRWDTVSLSSIWLVTRLKTPATPFDAVPLFALLRRSDAIEHFPNSVCLSVYWECGGGLCGKKREQRGRVTSSAWAQARWEIREKRTGEEPQM